MTEQRQPNFLLRLWRGFWNGLTAFRIAVFNILFLLVLALILRALFFSGDPIVVEPETTLVIAPAGMIVEEFTGNPVERALNEALGQQPQETRLRDLLRALELAAEDDDVAQVLISTDQLLGVSPGSVTELAAAVDRFRESGKPVIAYGGAMAQSGYAIASLADEVWIDPDGGLLIEGFSYYRNYFQEGLEKLRVDVNLFRVGEFKSAMEPYIRNDMSEADREAGEYFIGGLWQEYLETVARYRGMPVERLIEITQNPVQLLAQSGGDASAAALDAGLVDRLMTRPEARLELARRGTADDEGGFRQIDMDSYLSVPRARGIGKDKVGVVVASGTILEGRQSPGMIGADSTAELLREAARDDDIKAVVFRIDSGGGSAFASEIIRQEMLALRESGKPVIVSMGDVAASGGYWIAMGADEIWAYPDTITGSIGIFGFLPTFQDSLDVIGVHTDGFGTTPLAGAFRPDLELPEAGRELIQVIIENGYERFIGLVARHRGMTSAEVDQVAQGRVWTGIQARDRGLIDQLGTLDQAIDAAARMAGLDEDFDTRYVQRRLGPVESFLANMGGQALIHAGIELPQSALPRLFGNDLYRRVLAQLDMVAAASERRGLPDVMAHCLCEAPR